MFLPRRILEERLRQILAEDVGQGDISTELVVPAGITAKAEVVSKDQGVVAGIEEAEILLESLDLEVEALVRDGEEVERNQVLFRICGDARTILSVERTLLNVLSRMSGIATATRKVIEQLQGSGFKTRVACTRKTAPGLLYFDKKAVLLGGGDTHRLHLDDMILIKDNHVSLAGSVRKAVVKAKEHASLSKKIEVEVSNIEDVMAAVEAGADIVMLDNFSPKRVEKAVALLKKKGLRGCVVLEASGGITSENVVEFARSGVDLVSMGEITHSTRALNMSLEVMPVKKGRST